MSDDTSSHAAFDAFYRDFEGSLRAFNANRRRALAISLMVSIPTVLVAALVVYAVTRPGGIFPVEGAAQLLLPGIVVVIPTYLFLMFILHNTVWNYTIDTTRDVLDALVKALDPDLKFRGAAEIDLKALREAGLFADLEYERCDVTQAVSGRRGGLDIRFSCVKLVDRVVRNNSTDDVTRFDGVIYDARCSTPFRGRTIVLQTTAARMLDSVGAALPQATGRLLSWADDKLQKELTAFGQRIVLDDAEFERRFVVYTNDEDEARILLDPAVTARIVAVHDELGRAMRIGFCGDRVLVALHWKEDLFEAPLWRSLLRPRLYRRVWQRIITLADLGQALGLERVCVGATLPPAP